MTRDEKTASSLTAEIEAYFRDASEPQEEGISRESGTYEVERRVRALRKSGKAEEAMALVWKSLAKGRASPLLWLEAATTLSAQNRHGEALAAIDELLESASASAQVWALLGQILSRHGKNPAAEPIFRRALKLDPAHKAARMWLAQWLAQLARYEQSAGHFIEMRTIDPDSLDAKAGLAQVMISQGNVVEAEPMLEEVLAKKSEHLDARLGAARGALLRGDFAAGWPAYEWRRKRSDLKMPKITGPEWDGSPICGKTIVVYAEQGFGDVLQFIRYIPLMAAEGARVVLLIPKELERLCQCMADHAEIRSTLSSLPPFDFHVPLLSVPQFFLERIEGVPADVPYLDVPPNPKQKLPVPFGTRLKVGIVWAGRPTHANDRHRSQKIELFLPLAGIPGVTIYSLQAGPRAADIHKFAHPALVGDLSPHLKDFVDTANVIKQLDLVVAVDTSVAHLAGALGKPVWVLIPFAPDWRWLLEGEKTPWYPTMRLLRQSTPDSWRDVMSRIEHDLRGLVAERPEANDAAECRFVSLFTDADGAPRYRMRTPASFLTDPGIRYLIERERAGIGYEYATRSFLDAHLQAGDLFIDVGAHWGVMSLHAATHPSRGVDVLACEPTPRNVPHLRRWIDDNGLADVIELIPAAISDGPGRGSMLPQSTMGHSLEKGADAGEGEVEITTIDALLAARPHLRDRRVIVKIDVEGTEADVIAGMAELLGRGHVAAIIWERGRTYDAPANAGLVGQIRARLAELGFTAWRFEAEDKAGRLSPFIDDGRIDNVFELAPGSSPARAYGLVRPAPPQQPADPVFEQFQKAAGHFQKGLKLQAQGAADKALSAYTEAATLDRRNPDLYNNLGVALQRLGRFPAAEAAYRQALHHGAGLGSLSNLGSALREQGRLDEAYRTHAQVLAAAPKQARWLVNAGHAASDLGRPDEAMALYEKALEQEPDNADIRKDLAETLLRQEDPKAGFERYDACHAEKRPADPKIVEWNGTALDGATLLVEHAGTIEDAILFARYLRRLRQAGAGRVVLRAAGDCARLMRLMEGVDELAGPDEAVEADFRTRLTALPLLSPKRHKLEDRPYLVPRRPGGQEARRERLGLAWASSLPWRRGAVPLSQLLPLLDDPRFSIHALQRGERAQEVSSLTAGALIRQPDAPLDDPADLAEAIATMDAVLTVDPLVAHLAGAMGVPTLALLPPAIDWRWQTGPDEKARWHSSVQVERMTFDGLTEGAMRGLREKVVGLGE